MVNTVGPCNHTFHIPVMGTGFTVDAPLRVAKYGISSVISLVDDVLVEQMRKYHCAQSDERYEEISSRDEDARARRITAYLDLVDHLVQKQVTTLQSSPFEAGSEITRYYNMLPDTPLKRAYRDMLATTDPDQRMQQQDQLRRLAIPGSIDVNIMSKGDRDAYRNGEKLPAQFSDASAALRGYANSSLRSSIVFSAGINPRLYRYVAEFEDFLPDEDGAFKKKVILKVSDFHSAAVQGRFLAKRGVWVSEYRIESGLNCGGHAFATKGLLMGPVLEEFQEKREELAEQLHGIYVKALAKRGRSGVAVSQQVRVTVQGGIGTAGEDVLLREYYGVDGTGWATPFMLVPEVTNVDADHLEKLAAAIDGEVYLSDGSPFGLPFWNLRESASEIARRERIANDRPGSACARGYVKLFNTEFTARPICTASRQYQRLKLQQLETEDLTEEQREAVLQNVLAKSCICHDLAGGATVKKGIDPEATPAICCGPSIVDFAKVASLEEMVGHIYGRISLLANSRRPHMFIRELALYIDYLRDELRKYGLGLSPNSADYFCEFRENLLSGIRHYRNLANQFISDTRGQFLVELDKLRESLDAIPLMATC